MSINPNQFAMETVQGQSDLGFHGSVITAEVSASQATALVAGQAVKLEDSAGGLPKVLSLAASSEAAFGVVLRNLKDSTFPANARVEIALEGSVVYMTAAAAIARGAKVEFVQASNKVTTAAGTNPVLGFALDKAAADTDLIRVYILTPAVTSAETIADVAGLQDALDALEASAEGSNQNLLNTVTLAEVNAGKTILAVPTGKRAVVLDFVARSNGAFADGDSIDLLVGAANVASLAQAQLTNGAVLFPGETGVTLGAAFGQPGADGDDIIVDKTGSDFTTATDVKFTVTYALIDA